MIRILFIIILSIITFEAFSQFVSPEDMGVGSNKPFSDFGVVFIIFAIIVVCGIAYYNTWNEKRKKR